MCRMERNTIRDELSSSVGSSLFEFNLPNKQYSMSPSLLNSSGLNEIRCLRDELVNQSAKQIHWEDRILQASKACEAWKSEADESHRKVIHKKYELFFVFCINIVWVYFITIKNCAIVSAIA